MAVRELPKSRPINNEVTSYVLWEQRLGRRKLLLDHSAHHHYLLLLRQRMGRQQLRLRLWLRQRLRLRQRLLLSGGKGGAEAPLLL